MDWDGPDRGMGAVEVVLIALLVGVVVLMAAVALAAALSSAA